MGMVVPEADASVTAGSVTSRTPFS
jgi:hypothetical protein